MSEASTIEPKASSRTGIWIRIIGSLVLAGAFVAAVTPYLDAIPDDPRLPLWVVPAYLASLLPYHLLRAGRWYALVAPLGDARPWTVTRIGLAGYMWIALLPFRLGEFARPLFLAQKTSIPVGRALGTVAIERVVDGLTICGLFFVGTTLAGRPDGVEAIGTAAIGVMAAFAVALLALLFMALRPHHAGRWIRAIGGRLSPKLVDAAAKTVTGVAEGLAALPSWRALAGFWSLSIAYWLANAAGMWVLAVGCELPMTFAESIVVLAVMNLALLVPGGPAQLGVFQTGVALALGLYFEPGMVRERGSVFVFYLYLCQLGTIALLGVTAQRSLRLDWRAVLRLRGAPRPSTATPNE